MQQQALETERRLHTEQLEHAQLVRARVRVRVRVRIRVRVLG